MSPETKKKLKQTTPHTWCTHTCIYTLICSNTQGRGGGDRASAGAASGGVLLIFQQHHHHHFFTCFFFYQYRTNDINFIYAFKARATEFYFFKLIYIYINYGSVTRDRVTFSCALLAAAGSFSLHYTTRSDVTGTALAAAGGSGGCVAGAAQRCRGTQGSGDRGKLNGGSYPCRYRVKSCRVEAHAPTFPPPPPPLRGMRKLCLRPVCCGLSPFRFPSPATLLRRRDTPDSLVQTGTKVGISRPRSSNATFYNVFFYV